MVPTIAEITGFKIPKNVLIDGVSIAKVLNNTEKRLDEGFLFLEYEELTGYRKGDWKVKDRLRVLREHGGKMHLLDTIHCCLI